MGRSFLITFIMLIAEISHAQYSYILHVRNQELEGKKIKLYLLDNKAQQAWKTDSSTIKNGMARFKGTMSQPVHFAELGFKIQGKSASIKFPLDSGEHSLRLETGTDLDGLPGISGLETNSMRIWRQADQLWHSLYDKYPLTANGRAIPKAIFLEDLKNQLQLVSNHPKDYFSVLHLYQTSAREVSLQHATSVLEAWAKLDTGLSGSPLGLSVYERQKNYIRGYLDAQVGKKITDFTVSDIEGNTFDTRALRGQNYLIVLSATWCLPCQKQLPHLKALYDKYKTSGLKVVYLNNDDNIAKWKAHVKKNGLTWINVSERVKFQDSRIPRSLGIYAVPTCILVNAEGKITYNSDQGDTGLDKLDAAIKKTI